MVKYAALLILILFSTSVMASKQVSGFERTSFWFVPPSLTDNDINKQIDVFVRNGVNGVIIGGGGHHYFHNDIPNMPRQIEVTRKIVKLCHKHGIRVCEHHSVVLTGDTDFAKAHTDWLMKSFDTDKSASVIPEYQTRSFCPNNPQFLASYWKMLSEFIKATGVDAVMCDDASFYMGCSCNVCAEKWHEQVGGDINKAYTESRLPGTPQWRQWNEVHRQWMHEYWRWLSVKIKKDFPKVLCFGLSISITSPWSSQTTLIPTEAISESADGILWEIYNPADFYSWRRISGEAAAFTESARVNNYHMFALPYADTASKRDIFDPEEETFMWAFAKAYGMSFVLSRVFLTGLEPNAITRPYWNFEKKNMKPYLNSEPYAPVGIMFSADSRNADPAWEAFHVMPYLAWSGACLDNYLPWRAIGDETLDKSIPRDIRILVLPNVFAISDARLSAVERFVARGGKLIITYMSGVCDQTGQNVLDRRRTDLQNLTGIRINKSEMSDKRADITVVDAAKLPGKLEAYTHPYGKGLVIYLPERFEYPAFQDLFNEGDAYKPVQNPELCMQMADLIRSYTPGVPVIVKPSADTGQQLITYRKDKAGRLLIHVLNIAGSRLGLRDTIPSPSRVIWSKPGSLNLRFSEKPKSIQVLDLDSGSHDYPISSAQCEIPSPARYELIVIQQ